MRVVAVCHQFPPEFQGGTEILCLRTMQALAERGHTVTVVTADSQRDHGERIESTQVENLDVVRIPTRTRERFRVAARLQDELARPQIVRRLVDVVRANAPDIIHVHHFFQFGLPAIEAVAGIAPVLLSATDLALICPYATCILPDGRPCSGPEPTGDNCVAHHLSRPSATGSRHRDLAGLGQGMAAMVASAAGLDRPNEIRAMVMERLAWFRRAVGATECVLVSSDAMRATLTGFGAAAAKIAVLPHQAPAVAVPAGSVRSPMRIGFFGTLMEHKGAHVLVDAVRRIPSEILCEAIVRGKLAADPNYVSRLRRLAAGDARIRIVDEVPYAKFGEALGEVDIVVVPSIWPENAPLVLLSAIASGRYVVVSDQPGLTVAVAGPATGLIFPTGDAESLAAVLTKLIGNPAAVDPGRAGVDRSDHFASYVDGIEEQYRRAVTGRSQSKTHSLGGAM